LSVDAGHVAAIAVEGHDWQLKNFNYPAESGESRASRRNFL
jgi:hypothetical protein